MYRNLEKGLIELGYFLVMFGIFILMLLYMPWNIFPINMKPLIIISTGIFILIIGYIMMRVKSFLGFLFLRALSGLALIFAILLILTSILPVSIPSIFSSIYTCKAEKSSTFVESIQDISRIYFRFEETNVELIIRGWSENQCKIDVMLTVYGFTKFDVDKIIEETKIVLYSNKSDDVIELKPEIISPSWHWSKMNVKTILYVPYTILLNLDLDFINTMLNIYDVRGERIYVEAVNGKISISNSSFNEVYLKLVNGKMNIEMDSQNSLIKVINGEITLNIVPLRSGKYIVEGTNGKIDLYLGVNEDVGYSISASTSIGGVNMKVSELNIVEEKWNRMYIISKQYDLKPIKIELDIKLTVGKINIDKG